jgi:SAM-dependent methyltransferase
VIREMTALSRNCIRVRNLSDRLLSRMSATWRTRRKYGREMMWWLNELSELKRWYDGNADWCGIPRLTRDKARYVSAIWATNAVVTVHELVPHYLKILRLPRDMFAGKKVLEVGCGPLAPTMQFRGCERQGLDPLVDAYLRCGWPLYDYGITVVNARAESMPYVDSYFDAIVSVNALDHVDNFAQVASEIQRVLRVGDRLYLEIEYHEPRPLEPQCLNDDKVRASFTSCTMEKIRERSGRGKIRPAGEPLRASSRRYRPI